MKEKKTLKNKLKLNFLFRRWGSIVYPELADFPDWARNKSELAAAALTSTTSSPITNITDFY